jgi:hypothetical protein
LTAFFPFNIDLTLFFYFILWRREGRVSSSITMRWPDWKLLLGMKYSIKYKSTYKSIMRNQYKVWCGNISAWANHENKILHDRDKWVRNIITART